MNMLQSIFLRRKIVFDSLIPFGFERRAAEYVLTKKLPDSGFLMTVTVSADGGLSAVVTDPTLNEPYTLHLAEGASGSFVGSIRGEYEKLLSEIAEKCSEADVFKFSQTKELIAYVRMTYGNELEFLWDRFPDNAVWRRQDNQKWYAALLTVSKRKLGIDSGESVEIIDLRERPEAVEALVDGKKYFSGWHMNKKNWYTIILDGSVGTDEICGRIASSFALAAK